MTRLSIQARPRNRTGEPQADGLDVFRGPSPESPERFINRELSWLAFNERVLDEAFNHRHPLLERVRFLSISANNLDEFYMVRVAGLRGQVRAGVKDASQEGMTPAEQLAAIRARAQRLMHRQQLCWEALRLELTEVGIKVMARDELSDEDRRFLSDHFEEQLFPMLTPIAIDPAHPFPFIPNISLISFAHFVCHLYRA